MTVASSGRAAVGVPTAAKIPSPSTTTGTGAAATHRRADSVVCSCGRARVRSPARRSARCPPARRGPVGVGTSRCTISLRVSASQARARQHDQARAARAAAAAASSAAPSIPALPATTRTAPIHLWASTARTGHQPATSARSTRYCSASETSSPMSTISTSPATRRRRRRASPGLSAWNVTVRSAGRTPGPHAPVKRVDAGRDVDGKHRGVADVGGGPLAAEAGAERGVDHEVRRRKDGRALERVEHAHLDAGAAKRSAATRPSAPLLPWPAITLTTRPYVPPSMRSAARRPPGRRARSARRPVRRPRRRQRASPRV